MCRSKSKATPRLCSSSCLTGNILKPSDWIFLVFAATRRSTLCGRRKNAFFSWNGRNGAPDLTNAFCVSRSKRGRLLLLFLRCCEALSCAIMTLSQVASWHLPRSASHCFALVCSPMPSLNLNMPEAIQIRFLTGSCARTGSRPLRFD